MRTKPYYSFLGFVLILCLIMGSRIEEKSHPNEIKDLAEACDLMTESLMYKGSIDPRTNLQKAIILLEKHKNIEDTFSREDAMALYYSVNKMAQIQGKTLTQDEIISELTHSRIGDYCSTILLELQQNDLSRQEVQEVNNAFNLLIGSINESNFEMSNFENMMKALAVFDKYRNSQLVISEYEIKQMVQNIKEISRKQGKNISEQLIINELYGQKLGNICTKICNSFENSVINLLNQI